MNRIPRHVGIIPDGNRRWALARGLRKEAGYEAGLPPGLELLRLCSSVGVKELTSYGFTQDNTKRTQVQRKAFQKACIDGVEILKHEDANLLVLGRYRLSDVPKRAFPLHKKELYLAQEK